MGPGGPINSSEGLMLYALILSISNTFVDRATAFRLDPKNTFPGTFLVQRQFQRAP